MESERFPVILAPSFLSGIPAVYAIGRSGIELLVIGGENESMDCGRSITSPRI